jgi:hypothetical protein
MLRALCHCATADTPVMLADAFPVQIAGVRLELLHYSAPTFARGKGPELRRRRGLFRLDDVLRFSSDWCGVLAVGYTDAIARSAKCVEDPESLLWLDGVTVRTLLPAYARLAAAGVRFCTSVDPRFSIAETEEMRDIADQLGYIEIGGSGGLYSAGTYCIPVSAGERLHRQVMSRTIASKGRVGDTQDVDARIPCLPIALRRGLVHDLKRGRRGRA